MSMGGMNAWQWAEAYPDEMDGVMPVVSLPTKVSGRNLLWRRMIIDAIRFDPDWQGGDYSKSLGNFALASEILRLMIDGVPRLQTVVLDSGKADQFINEVRQISEKIDPNNILYSLKSSSDYDPEPGLASIKTQLFALNFSDDEFNPDELQILERLISKVPRGRYVVQPGSDISYGHLTMAHPELWVQQVTKFMDSLPDTSN
jgi:homoserine O-acetyltransferase